MPTTSTTDHDVALLRQRLSRIEGQVRGLQRMVSDERSCLDTLAQIAAVTHALQAVAVALASRHLRNSAHPPIEDAGSDPQPLPADIGRVLAQLLRT